MIWKKIQSNFSLRFPPLAVFLLPFLSLQHFVNLILSFPYPSPNFSFFVTFPLYLPPLKTLFHRLDHVVRWRLLTRRRWRRFLPVSYHLQRRVAVDSIESQLVSSNAQHIWQHLSLQLLAATLSLGAEPFSSPGLLSTRLHMPCE